MSSESREHMDIYRVCCQMLRNILEVSKIEESMYHSHTFFNSFLNPETRRNVISLSVSPNRGNRVQIVQMAVASCAGLVSEMLTEAATSPGPA